MHVAFLLLPLKCFCFNTWHLYSLCICYHGFKFQRLPLCIGFLYFRYITMPCINGPRQLQQAINSGCGHCITLAILCNCSCECDSDCGCDLNFKTMISIISIFCFLLLISFLNLFFFFKVQNAVEYLKVIGALDENENLTVLGEYYSFELHFAALSDFSDLF